MNTLSLYLSSHSLSAQPPSHTTTTVSPCLTTTTRRRRHLSLFPSSPPPLLSSTDLAVSPNRTPQLRTFVPFDTLRLEPRPCRPHQPQLQRIRQPQSQQHSNAKGTLDLTSGQQQSTSYTIGIRGLRRRIGTS